MNRLSVVWRVALVMSLVLLALQVLQGAALYRERSRDLPGGTVTIPERLAALVPLLRAANAEQRALILRAAGGDVALSLAGSSPVLGPGEARIGRAEMAIRDAASALTVGDVVVVSRASPVLEPFGVTTPHPWWVMSPDLRIGVRVDRATWLLAEPRGRDVSRQLFGWPAGFWAGLIGNAAAAFAILMLLREARPLRRLAACASRTRATARPAGQGSASPSRARSSRPTAAPSRSMMHPAGARA